MYTDSELGALTFQTLFEKGKKLIQKAAPIVAATQPRAEAQGTAPGTLEPVVSTPPPAERPGWLLPALLGGGAFLAFKLFRKGRR
jgi:hypothetical protein